MNDEEKSIHEFDINLICEYFSVLERQGPGSPEVTIKALSFIENLTGKSLIADIGCGTGGQTMVLAQNAPGHITGVDLFPGFIDLFNSNARRLNQIAEREEFLKKHEGNKAAAEFIANETHEAMLYDKYKEFYGYVFYIGRKSDWSDLSGLEFLSS